MIDHNPAHELRGRGEKVGAVVPLRMGIVRQPEIGIIHERGGLQGVAGPLPTHVMVRQPL
jgi:hypothetical protein